MAKGSGTTRNSVKGGRSLKMYNASEYVVPFPLPKNKEDANEIARYQYGIGQFSGLKSVPKSLYKDESINMNLLSNSQETVQKSKIDNMKNSGLKPNQIRDEENSLPFVIKYNDTYVIQDGHHRAVYAYMMGEKKLRSRVLDLKDVIKYINRK